MLRPLSPVGASRNSGLTSVVIWPFRGKNGSRIGTAVHTVTPALLRRQDIKLEASLSDIARLSYKV